MADSSSIHLTIVDGRRQPLPANTNVLARVTGGAKQPGPWAATGSGITLPNIPFTDTDDDAYYVFAKPSGYQETVSPYRVPLKRNGTSEVALMAPADNGSFHFQPWEQFRDTVDPRILKLITNGAADPAQRYNDSTEASRMQFGALLNLATAIRDIPLDDRPSPLDGFFWQVRWDLLAPDRFWAWVDARLVARIARMADLHAFAEEKDAAFWHPGIDDIGPATKSWKQTRFDVTNVQLTFHENSHLTLPDGQGNQVDCVIVEPDIDLYKDLLSHGLAEVVVNLWTGGKTDPRTVYAMRWMATRQEGVADFNPPVTIE